MRCLTRISLVPAAILALGLVACGAPEDNPAWQLGGHPGLLYRIKQHYERHGIEEGGRCTAPIMEGVTRSQVVDDGNDQLEVTLTYYYRDWLRDGDDCDRKRPLRCGVMRECRGFATRSFTVAKGEDGLKVTAMTGSQWGQR
jgi:hypothetical protein